MKISNYVTLGRSGLKVSPLCLGTMTFGEDWGWGSSEDTARQIFNLYIEQGGNFIDTADGYTNGTSELLVGKFVTERKLRDQAVLATKFTFNAQKGNPNAGGNGRKNIYRALEGSLKRLGTDYIDFYWLHTWDKVTPVEEVLLTLVDLVREGKIRYFGLSDVPAWYLAKMQTIAEINSLHRISALQLEYSLTERCIEREHIPAAQEFGLGICPWSPLASGLLTGKYKRDGVEVKTSNGEKEGRLAIQKGSSHPGFAKLFTERNWRIVDVLLEVANSLGKSPAQVALNWVVHRPGVTSTIIGATKLAQLKDNFAAIDFQIPAEALAKLDECSALDSTVHPYLFFTDAMQAMVHGEVPVRAWGRVN
jgi:aryl-alcohol dehydrogenase-like predicted oxidoreductase